MSTSSDTNQTIQSQADMEEIMRLVSAGHPVTGPELRRRVRERADEVRREMLERFGVTDIAADVIRDARDE